MRYRLRTLLIVLAIGPPIIVVGYGAWRAFDARRWKVQVIESNYGTGTYHTTTIKLPANTPGFRWRQGRDGSVREVPVE